MVWAWQLWLSPRPERRRIDASQKTFMAAGNMARFEIFDEPDGRWGLRETHYIDNPRVKAGQSGPPLHIHLKQDEFFVVDQGILAAEIDGKEHLLTKNDGVLPIYRNSRHRFWSHPSATESLIFHGWADPCKDQDHILDANMLRNVVGYFADCHEAGLAPSAFQLILFYDNASSLLTPPGLNWMPLWLLIIVHYVLANWIAAGLLGYKPAYPEDTTEPGPAGNTGTDGVVHCLRSNAKTRSD